MKYTAEPEKVAWIGKYVFPLEPALRKWLSRNGIHNDEIDDTIQDVYCKFMQIGDIESINQPRSYIYSTLRHILIDKFRRNRIVNITYIQDLSILNIKDKATSPEDSAIAKSDAKWLLSLLEKLPKRCRKVFECRKVRGMSQAATAAHLHLSENIIEKDTAKGLRLIMQMSKKRRSGAISFSPSVAEEQKIPRAHTVRD